MGATMTNLKQVTLEADGQTVNRAHPLPVSETGHTYNTQEAILMQLKEINIHLAIITEEIVSTKDINTKKGT